MIDLRPETIAARDALAELNPSHGEMITLLACLTGSAPEAVIAAVELVGGVPWRGGPQLSAYAEAAYAQEQADDIYDLYGEDE